MDKYDEIRRIGKVTCYIQYLPAHHMQGSEGSVYLVTHKQTGHEYVVKKIFTRNSRATAMHEAEILSKLHHPHVVFSVCLSMRADCPDQLKYHESFFDQNGDHLCIVTDYCAVIRTYVSLHTCTHVARMGLWPM